MVPEQGLGGEFKPKDPRVEALKQQIIDAVMKEQGGIMTVEQAVKFALEVERRLAKAKEEIGVE